MVYDYRFLITGYFLLFSKNQFVKLIFLIDTINFLHCISGAELGDRMDALLFQGFDPLPTQGVPLSYKKFDHNNFFLML